MVKSKGFKMAFKGARAFHAVMTGRLWKKVCAHFANGALEACS